MLRTPGATTLALLVLVSASPGPARAQTPLIGVVGDCVDRQDMELLAASLFAFRLNPVLDPDVLMEQSAVGGTSLGNPVISGSIWQVVHNWREQPGLADVGVVVLTADGALAVDSDSLIEFGGVYGRARLQAVGAHAQGAPRVAPIVGGYEVEFRPIVELADDDGGCLLGGHPTRGRRLIAGWNVYRLAVDDWPSPRLGDFSRHGHVAHVDLAGLDLDAAGPEADLDPRDALTLRDLDGMARSGDETLVFRDAARSADGMLRADAPRPDRAYWYRVQPVLGVDPDALARSGASGARRACVRQDRDGDGIAEVLDVANDGHPDFIDPSGRGLGLTWNGEILSSPLPGLGRPPLPFDVDGDGILDVHERGLGLDPGASNARTDSDGDGLDDLLEAEIGTDPLDPDTDGGGEPDGDELEARRSPVTPADDVAGAAGALLPRVLPPAGRGRRGMIAAPQLTETRWPTGASRAIRWER